MGEDDESDHEERLRLCELRLEACDETTRRMSLLLSILQEMVGAELWTHALTRLAAAGGTT